MRYINKQRHAVTCGPTAIANALKWLGGNITYNEIYELCNMHEAGMWHKDMSLTLKLFGIKYKMKRHTSIQEIEKILDIGNSVILSFEYFYDSKYETGHYAFIPRQTNSKFFVTNFYTDKGSGFVLKQQFKSWFIASKRWSPMGHPKSWEIKI